MFLFVILIVVAAAIYIWNTIKDYINSFIDFLKTFYDKHIKTWLDRQSESADQSGNNTSAWDKIKNMCAQVKKFFEDWFNKTPDEIKTFIVTTIRDKLTGLFQVVYGWISKNINLKKLILTIRLKASEIILKVYEWMQDYFSGPIDQIFSNVDFNELKEGGIGHALLCLISGLLKGYAVEAGYAITNATLNAITKMFNGIKWIAKLFNVDIKTDLTFDVYKSAATVKAELRQFTIDQKRREIEQYELELNEIEEIEKQRSKEELDTLIQQQKEQIENNEETTAKEKAQKVIDYVDMLKLKLMANPTFQIIQLQNQQQENLATP